MQAKYACDAASQSKGVTQKDSRRGQRRERERATGGKKERPKGRKMYQLTNRGALLWQSQEFEVQEQCPEMSELWNVR